MYLLFVIQFKIQDSHSCNLSQCCTRLCIQNQYKSIKSQGDYLEITLTSKLSSGTKITIFVTFSAAALSEHNFLLHEW